MARAKFCSRAVLRAALLLMFAVPAVTVLPPTQLEAAMRAQRLWLVTAAGRETPIDVEVAEDPQDKQVGLMFRTDLPDGKGMLFAYESPREVTMWMHNTYIPLDMVFIRPDGVVHRIETRAEPMSERIISSQGPVIAVLELAGGAAERLGLKAGDRVRHPIFGAPDMAPAETRP